MEIETRYALLLKEFRETQQFRVDAVENSKRLAKEADIHAEEKKGFKEALDRL